MDLTQNSFPVNVEEQLSVRLSLPAAPRLHDHRKILKSAGQTTPRPLEESGSTAVSCSCQC